MYNDENHGQRGNASRKQVLQKFQEIKKGNYSPSASYNYNYNAGGGYGNQQPQRPANHGNQIQGNQNVRRREGGGPPRRDAGNNGFERLARQNDLIIKLLKEIRDRLPPSSAPVAGKPPRASRKKHHPQPRVTEEHTGEETAGAFEQDRAGDASLPDGASCEANGNAYDGNVNESDTNRWDANEGDDNEE